MAYVYYNPNPEHDDDIDCVVRAICKLLDLSWEEAYIEICMQGYYVHRIPIGNTVWPLYLESRGFKRYDISR